MASTRKTSGQKKKAVIIGGGINGLVAAFYLNRGGYDVTVLERKARVGGACSHDTLYHKGKSYQYPNGASVLGFMQDFVYKETGLDKALTSKAPQHPQIVYGPNDKTPCVIHGKPKHLAQELRHKWNEQGDVEGFERDCEKVAAFLRKGYRKADVPTVAAAKKALGTKLAKLWITGSAKDLMDHYFTAEETKLFYSIAATESGPVPLDSPYSAFNIPLMASGSVFGGRWGYVKGGLWTLVDTLGNILRQKGVKIITDAKVENARDNLTVTFNQAGKKREISADKVIFATDPLTAAKARGDKALIKKISKQSLLGSSGKLVLFFKNPVKWKHDTGIPDFSSALRFIMPLKTMKESEKQSKKVRKGKTDYAPGSVQVYCEGAGNRALGGKRPYDILSIFFKNMGFGKKGAQQKKVKKKIKKIVLAKIKNQKDLITGVLLAPKDLNALFYFPGGNIDHTGLSNGQTFFDRNYSNNPKKSFYRFGSNPDIYYCAAGSYPCGSIAGTTGYMCAKQILAGK